jgi:LPS-assembly protein
LPPDPEPEPPSELTPDKLEHVVRPNAPPIDRTYIGARDKQESEGGIYHLRGNAVVEQSDSILKADEIDYNEETGDAEARGHVFYQNFAQNEKITCDRVEYNLDSQRGKFYNVHGYVKTRVDARPGLLTSNNPFYFEAKWAERIEEKYILHDGMITGCKLPHPWWTLRGPKFDVIPEQRAIAYNSWLHVKKLPLFYTPFFYKALEKEPRKSGFLTPNIGHSTLRGFIFGTGYFWAINRSYDLTYLVQDWSARGIANHLDVRGKPNDRTDFNVIVFGVDDKGIKENGTLYKYPGADVTATFRSDMGDGWVARGNVDYLTSLAFREQFTDSFNEAIFSASTSTGWIGKHFGSYNFDVEAQRVQLFQDATPNNFIILHKLPEVDFSSRDQELSDGSLPFWLSFDSSAGLLHRSDPTEYVTGTAHSCPGWIWSRAS